MEKICYAKGITGGEVFLPPSKSAAHRALLCAALTGEECRIYPVDDSADMLATFNFIRALGTDVVRDGQHVTLRPGAHLPQATVDCIESGSTLRFAIPIAAALGKRCTFVGRGRLPQRPIDIYGQILRGVRWEGRGLPLTLSGQLQSGDFSLPGDISSQFITGLLLALPLLPGDSRILLTTPLESESYVSLTLQVMADFGVLARRTEEGYYVPGGQRYRAQEYRVEADWSQCAFFLSMAALCSGRVGIHGLNFQSLQGDRKCLQLFEEMGLSLWQEGGVLYADNPYAHTAFRGLRGIEVDAADIPDMVPALAVTAALARGRTCFYHAGRLRLKESDRLEAVCRMISGLGGQASETADGLLVTGVPQLRGGLVQGYGDHRMVMAAAAAAGASDGPVEVTDPQSIEKSYPRFFDAVRNLGGQADVIHMG